MAHAMYPVVSVILPTFNRAQFLKQAFASIAAQTFRDWELVLVDDGSTDDTPRLVAELAAALSQPVTAVRQENRGAYGARNTGLRLARGEFIAFFDSDDLWLPHHLERCAAALRAHPEIDWVYGSCRTVDEITGRVVDENNFFPGGRPRPFLSLRTRTAGELRIIDDPGIVECQILHGLYCGLQNSMIRARVFAGARFEERFRVVDDVMFLLRALVRGIRVAYYSTPHVVYRMHGGNSSAAGHGSHEKAIGVFREMVDGYTQLAAELPFTRRQRRALHRRIAREYFWHLGYEGLWSAGRRKEALAAFRSGMAFWPWDPRFWKTYALAVARTYAGWRARLLSA